MPGAPLRRNHAAGRVQGSPWTTVHSDRAPTPPAAYADAMGTDELTRLSKGKYLSLTTFKKSGEAVATPVWVVRDGDRLLVTTGADSWKVKRIRNNPRVLLAPCDARGNLKGPQVGGVAAVQDAAASATTRSRVIARYGIVGRALALMEKFRGGQSVGLELRPEAPAADAAGSAPGDA